MADIEVLVLGVETVGHCTADLIGVVANHLWKDTYIKI